MTLRRVVLPDDLRHRPLGGPVESLIDVANERIESFLLTNDVSENFVTCDFHLVAAALDYLAQSHLLAGDRFCELGAGFGVVAAIASVAGLRSHGVEVEPNLAAAAADLVDELGVEVPIVCGSLIPPGIDGLEDLAMELEHVQTDAGDAYAELGLGFDEIDLFFAFPWPGESGFFETLIDRAASVGACLLMYQGRDGMTLSRKVDVG